MCSTDKCCKKICPYILGFLDICGLASDWMFFCDLKLTEKGLVYGPPDDQVVYALLAFCIIGSVMFTLDVVGHAYSLCAGEPNWLNTDVLSLVTILLADIPQVSISVYIAYCREDGVSYFQFAKAAFVFLGFLFRLFVSVYFYWQDSSRKCLKGVLMVGLIVNLVLAILVFVFGNIRRTGPTFTVPTEIIDEQFNDQRYFQNVSVFIHHTDFGSSGNQINWLHIMGVYDVYENPDTSVSYIYKYEKSATLLKFAVRAKKTKGGNIQTKGSPECYLMDLTTRRITNITTNICWNSSFTLPTSLHLHFTYSRPEFIFRRKIFGDIQYNRKVRQNGSCMPYNEYTNGLTQETQLTLAYYRVNGTMTDFTGPHLLSDTGQPRFYLSPSNDLQDIADVWRTGYGDCEPSGTRAPTIDDNVQLDCSE